MKKKILLLGLLFVGLLFGATQVLGANPYWPDETTNYERIPAGEEITSPVTLSATLSEYPAGCGSNTFWNFGAEGTETYLYDEFLPNVPASTLTIDKIVDFPLDSYNAIEFWCCETATSTDTCDWYAMWEYDDVDNEIFVVVDYPTDWLPVGPNFVEKTLDYVRGFLGSGLFPFVAMVIGIPLSFVIIRRVIALMPKK